MNAIPRNRVGWLAALRLAAMLGVLLLAGGVESARAEPHARDPRAAIASAHPLATAAGYEILGRGGNAFDAAVAVAAALGVVEPYSSGLGGGGFWLLHRARDQFQVMVDGRETAPGSARPERYLDAEGKPVRGALTQGGNSVAVPGTPAALAHVARGYGRLTLGENLAPAIRLARDGFEVDPRYARIAHMRASTLQADAGAARIFLHNGRAPAPRYVLRQPELAATLELLAARGAEGFYGGRVARALIEAVNRAGGLWQPSDLAAYRVIERRPVRFRHRDATIVTASLPSAGGIALAQALHMLERFEISDPQTLAGAHLVIEVLRRAFRDRALYLGDSDFVTVPVPRLVSKAYAGERAAGINRAAATRSEALGDGEVAAGRGSTTHLSVIDAEGNRVAATLTINWLFGSGIVAGDTGVLLNNEMDDFSLGPDVPNTYLLRGGAANAIAPGKRPLSSMTPTFIEDEKGVLIVGAPGGSRIVSQVVLTVLEYLRTPRVDLERLVGLPRFHHQWWPDRVEIEPEGFPAEWRAALEAKGHRVETAGRKWGNLQAVFWSRATGLAVAASDPRGADVGWY